ncbi:unnamed protein product [Discula destructiva]
MDDTSIFLDVSSPSNTSYQYLHGDHDQYLDNSHSESHSSATSPYDMTLSGDFASTNTFPSPESREADDGYDSPRETVASGETEAQLIAAAKRKRENRYKNAPPSVLSRRRAQNRASQRAYRERKDQRIKDLEQMLHDARTRNNILSQAYAELQAEYVKLKSSSPLTQQQQPPAHQQHHLSSSYAAIPDSSVSAELGGGFVDTASMAVLHAGNGLESYLYPDVGSYTL